MPGPLTFALVNTSSTDEPIYAYVTGLALPDNKRCFIRSDGKSLCYPTDPSTIGSPLQDDCAITLGGPGSTTSITVPQIAGGRVWLSRNKTLTFLLNPGPALVEPSVLNPSDPNAKTDFAFVEFTLNDAQIYANITYVDFVPRLSLGIALETRDGSTQLVQGLPCDGLDSVAALLTQQTAADKQPWSSLIVHDEHGPLRALNPTHSEAVGASFDKYFDPYVSRVWEDYASDRSLAIDTQSQAGILNSNISHKTEGQTLNFGNETFSRPTTADIFGCNSGPFSTAGASAIKLAVIPRLAAGFNRSCLLAQGPQPSAQSTYYGNEGPVTNHYSRIVHEVAPDGKGYGFAYDDVQPDAGPDQSGKVNAGDPVRFVIKVGGGDVGVQRGQDDQPAATAAGPASSGPEPALREQQHGGLRGKLHDLKAQWAVRSK